MKNIKIILSAALFTTLFGCVNSDNYNTPDLSGDCKDLIATKSVQDIAAVATSTAQQWNSTSDSIIEAYVTSSDEGGNFYKSISLVSIDGTKGFSMPIDAYNLYTKYEPGRKVFINLNKRYYANNTQTASLEIGSLYNLTQVGRVSGVEYEKTLTRSCTKVNENTLVNNITIAAAKNNANLNKLIEFNNVQFRDASLGKKYFDPSLNNFGGATNHEITDEFGNKIIVRFSEFATFAAKSIPSFSGKIRGVLTKYGSDYQFMIRTENDINLTNPRLTIDFAPPVGGSSISYLGSFTENFESYTAGSITTGQTNFPKYINDPAVGSKYWYTATFSSNKYIVMSAFSSSTSSQDQNNKTYFIVPVDFTAANNMKFKTQDRFNVGGVLKVYTSTNYIPGGNIATATLTNITSNFNIASGTTGSSTTAFEDSNVYNFPAGLIGNGFIIFEYTGGYSFNPDLTTTMHLDDIVIN